MMTEMEIFFASSFGYLRFSSYYTLNKQLVLMEFFQTRTRTHEVLSDGVEIDRYSIFYSSPSSITTYYTTTLLSNYKWRW